MTELSLYEVPSGGVPRDQRAYKLQFDRSSTRFVSWELNLRHPKHRGRIEFIIIAVYYRADGSVFARQTIDSHLEANWTSSWHDGNWGWKDPGKWPVGSYRVELSIGGEIVASSPFEVIP